MTYTPIYKYVMKGTINAPPYQKVTWAVFNTPDMTGAQSGYSNLIDIFIDYTVIDNQVTEPGAVPVFFTPGGNAGGDLSGTYPNPSVAKIQGSAVTTTAPSDQQVLIWNAAHNQYEPGAQLSGPPSGAAGGDLSGTYPNPSVVNIHGTSVPATPSANQVLRATNGTTATWTTLDNNSIAASAGIVYSKLNLTGGIVDADVNSAAAIAGTKVNPNFGSQLITSTGALTVGDHNAINTIVGSLAFESRTISTSDTIDVLQKDLIIYVDTSSAPVSLTLPAPTDGRLIIIKDKKQTFGTNNLTVVRHGTEKIDGVAASLVLDVSNKELIITSDATDWYTNNSPATPLGPAGGDLSGTYPNPTVAKVNAVSYPASPSTNTVPVVTGANTVTYQQIANAQVSSSAAIAYSKLNLTGGIVNADVNASAAIAGTKISPNFGSQTIQTTGNISITGQFNMGFANTGTNVLGGSLAFNSGAVYTSNYTIDTGSYRDLIVFADTSGGAFTITLPAPTGGRFLIIKDAKQSFATNNLTIARSGTEKIDGVAASLVLNTNNQELILVSDGTDWFTQGSLGASGTAGGDLSGTYPNPTVAKINGTTVTTAGGSLAIGAVLRTTGLATSDWGAVDLSNSAAVTGVLSTSNLPSLSGDVTGPYTSTVVSAISGTSPIAITPSTLQWTTLTTSPTLKQDAWALTGHNGQTMTIQAQSAADNGGGLTLNAGSTTFAGTGGDVNINGGTALGSANNGGSINLTGGSSAGTGGAIAGNINITGGASSSNNGGQVVITGGNSVSTQPGGISLTGGTGSGGVFGVVSLTSGTTQFSVGNGAFQMSGGGLSTTGLLHWTSGPNTISSSLLVDADVSSSAAIAVSKLAPGTAGQFLQSNGTPATTWTTMTQDVTLSSAGVATINSISGSSPITIAPREFQWLNSISTPLLDQAALASTSLGSGSAGQNFSIVAQAGQAATGAAHNGGKGGDLQLSSGAGGTSGSATAGAPGALSLQLAGTELIRLSGSTIGNVTFTNTAAIPNFGQTTPANNNTPVNGATWTITAQSGSSAASGNNNGGNGGILALSAGTKGTHTGSGTDGIDGYVYLQTAGTTRLTVKPTGVVNIANLGTGVVHSDSSGNLTSTTVGASEITNGTADQLLDTNHAGTATEWFTLGGDGTFASHNLTVVGLQTNAVHADVLGAAQDGYVLTWSNANSWWTAKASSGGGGGGVTWANDLTNSTGTNQYVSALSYSSSAAGGAIAINGTGTTLVWDKAVTAPTITQTAPSSGSGAGTAAVATTLSAQTGGATTGSATTAGAGGDYNINSGAGGSGSGGTNANGGNAGNIVLTPGAGGAKSGSGTAGKAGTIKLAGSQNVVVSSGKTSNYTIVKGDYCILIGTLSSSITITLPASPSTGDIYVIKTGSSCYQFVRNDAGTLTTVGQTVTVSPSSGNIDGQASYIMAQPYQSLTCIYTGSEWSII